MDELRRFEEKQKIANLQIDKRLATLELNLDELKTEFETISIPKDIDNKISKIEFELKHIRNELKHVHEENENEEKS